MVIRSKRRRRNMRSMHRVGLRLVYANTLGGQLTIVKPFTE